MQSLLIDSVKLLKKLPTAKMKILNRKNTLKNYENSSLYKTVYIFVVTDTTSTSVAFTVTGLGLIVGPLSTGVACELTHIDKISCGRIMKKRNSLNN